MSPLREFVIGIGIALAACSEPVPTDGQLEGRLLGEGLLSEMARTLKLTAPHRCARWPAPAAASRIEFGKRSAMLQGDILVPEGLSGSPELVVAVVADARSSHADTIAGIERLRAKLQAHKVEAVISVGGLGENVEAIGSVLRAISLDAHYLVVAFPGDRESVPAHREAVKNLLAEGHAIIDGSQYRMIDLGAIIVATLPGLAMTANLIAGPQGCEHVASDIKELEARLGGATKPTLVASYSPMRQRSASASDRGLGEVHVGEIDMQSLTGMAPVAFVHGAVGEASAKGKLKSGEPPASLATGSLEPVLGHSSALLLRIGTNTLRWQSLATN